MSFILESIKQAERDRKLRQQTAPEISIEYSAAHIDDIEGHKKRWLLLLAGLMVAAILIWGAAYYLTSKDRQYEEQLPINKISDAVDVETDVNFQAQSGLLTVPKAEVQTTEQSPSFASVAVKKLHTSDLKSVKLITENEEVFEPHVVSEPRQQKQSVKQVVSKNSNPDTKVGKVSLSEPKATLPIAKKSQVLVDRTENISNKQKLEKIYAELASLGNDKVIIDNLKLQKKVEEQQVQLKTANYVQPEPSVSIDKKSEAAKLSTSVNYTKQHEQAVNSGVPSFGELPYDIQERIPEFNVSVHMFHADPLQRRIRINGQMYTEGKSLHQDLALVEITRYGAVFDYQGNLFRFNVR